MKYRSSENHGRLSSEWPTCTIATIVATYVKGRWIRRLCDWVCPIGITNARGRTPWRSDGLISRKSHGSEVLQNGGHRGGEAWVKLTRLNSGMKAPIREFLSWLRADRRQSTRFYNWLHRARSFCAWIALDYRALAEFNRCRVNRSWAWAKSTSHRVAACDLAICMADIHMCTASTTFPLIHCFPWYLLWMSIILVHTQIIYI
jgi:hypothetical protein